MEPDQTAPIALILFGILEKLPFPSHLVKYFVKIGKISAKIHEIGKIKAIFRLGMTPISGPQNGQIKSLYRSSLIWVYSICPKDF